MFEKLFKKKNNAEVTVMEQKAPAYTVQDIHDEFDSAEDLLLKDAERLLEELQIPTESKLEEKANLILSLGFQRTAEVKQFNKLQQDKVEVEKKRALSKEQADLIRYYKQKYPFQKFLTEAELDRICEKYGLIYASVSNYKMEVPDKNLNEIAEANKHPLEDAYKPRNVDVIVVSCRDSCPKEFKKFFAEPFIAEEGDYHLVAELRSSYPTYAQKIAKLGYTGEMPKKGDYAISVETFNKGGLHIAAPDTHFDMDELEKVTEYGFQSKTACVVPDDPIVFRFCKGGVQVLSKWGAEGEDEALMNEKMN